MTHVRSRPAALGLLALALTGCAARVATLSPPPNGQAPPVAVRGPYLAIGTELTVRLDGALSTAWSHPGDDFTARLVAPLVAPGGAVLVPAGARLRGVVADVDIGPPRLILALESVETPSGPAAIDAQVVDTEKEVYLGGLPSTITPPLIMPGDPEKSNASLADQYGWTGLPSARYFAQNVVGEMRLPAGARVRLRLTRPLVPPASRGR